MGVFDRFKMPTKESLLNIKKSAEYDYCKKTAFSKVEIYLDET